ncbi:MAG: acetylglutamate kinase [Proteobacteria bacterium]|uniref:Acetylglutamate kinase n=1 Tax=Candidatus Avisuccinivibrio stercorigallinarum TaxID=2840704 RepID=A0A9D9D9H6_9GAMM|nr:acetylglutamate kinase [Candidatus Avisuccinivibrio stercorigallinarum]
MVEPVILKLSGKALNAKDELDALFQALKGRPALIVHGGGVEVDELLHKLGIESRRIDGLRVTTKEELFYISAVLAGACSRGLQAKAVAAGLNALSIITTDYHFLKTARLDPKYGEVGTAAPDDGSEVRALIERGYTPIMASLGIMADGSLLNINADDAAVAAATALKGSLVFLSDVKGVLNDGALLPELTEGKAQELIANGVISGGMTVKVNQAFAAARALHRPIYIGSIFDPDVIKFVETGAAFGTRIVPAGL